MFSPNIIQWKACYAIPFPLKNKYILKNIPRNETSEHENEFADHESTGPILAKMFSRISTISLHFQTFA